MLTTIRQISLIVMVAIGLLLIPGINVEANARHHQPHLHSTMTHHGVGFAAASFFKFHQHKQNPQQ
ncbi:MAG: hypothetical protein WA667_26095 [Candidatus Nitrosopolaris sp.]